MTSVRPLPLLGYEIRDYETSSALPRVFECPASATLERIEEASGPADLGSAKHEHLDHRARYGVDEAMARVQEVAKRWRLDEREAFFFGHWAKKFEWSPPAHSFGEIALALLDDGSVERTVGGRGQYPELAPGGRLHGRALLAGTNDVMWSEPEPLDLTDPAHPKCPPGSILWSGDYKGGSDSHVDPIDTNLQVASNALMSARWTGAKFAVPFVLYLDPPMGDWDAPARAWGPKELADAENRVRDTILRRRMQVAKVLAGAAADGWHEGPWCTFCPGKLSCPAKTAMMRRTADYATAIAPLDLTDDEAAWWALRITQIESFAKRARDYLKERVDKKGPIVLGNGLVWGPQTKTQSRIVPHVALPILENELEAGSLDTATRISRSAIEDAVRAEHSAKGIKRQLSKTMGRIMGRIKDAGGLEQETREQYGVHRPAEEIAAGTPEESDGEAAAQ